MASCMTARPVHGAAADRGATRWARPLRAAAWSAWLAVTLAACSRPAAGPSGVGPRPATTGAATALGARQQAPSSPPQAQRSPSDQSPAKLEGTTSLRLARLPGKRSVRGTQGLVVSVEPQASRAGIAVLESGGNAVDAAVAVGYALAVTHPSAGNIGGGGFMLIRRRGGPTVAIDFRETAPAGLNAERYKALVVAKGEGPAAVGVPGSVAGFNLAVRRFGQLPLERVLASAIRLASEGYRIGPRQAASLGWHWAGLSKNAAARAEFGTPGARGPRRLGSLHRRPELAATLTEIARHGDDGFYRGKIAEALARAVKDGGVMTTDDLAAYRAKLREPLTVGYRGLEVQVMPPPSGGGVVLVQALRMLEHLEAHKLDRTSWQHLHLLAEVLRRANVTRRFAVGDPDRLTTTELVDRERQWKNPMTWLLPHPIHRAAVTPSASIRPAAPSSTEEPETTHFGVVDRDGMAVSCTVTLSSGFGAEIVAPGTGVVLNDTAGAFAATGDNTVSPGHRPTSSMAPTLVLENGETFLILGSPGGDTIPSTLVQVLRNIVDYSMPLDEAIDAFRIHQGVYPDHFRYEGQRPPPAAALRALRLAGHQFSPSRTSMGDANCILLDVAQAWGYPDPREGGLAVAAREEH